MMEGMLCRSYHVSEGSIIFVKPNPQKLSHNWVNYEQFIAFVAEADDKFDEIWCEMLIGTGCLRLQNHAKSKKDEFNVARKCILAQLRLK